VQSIHAVRILLPADFSRSPRQTIGAAIRIASERDAQLVLVHAAESGDATADAEHALAAAVQHAIGSGIRRVAAELVVGRPADEIAAIVADGFDLVVIERGNAGDALVRIGACSVIAIHESADRPGRHVVCGTHGAVMLAAALRPDRITLVGDSLDELDQWAAPLYATSSAAIAIQLDAAPGDGALRSRLAADLSIDTIATGDAVLREPLPVGCSIAIARP
jgi:hypothetical protein